jgi:hypothetical protein
MASFKRLHKDKLIYDSVQGAKSLNLIKGIKAHKPSSTCVSTIIARLNSQEALISESSELQNLMLELERGTLLKSP